MTGPVQMLVGSRMVADVRHPRGSEVDLPFMRHRLARIRRFSGHPLALTVAQHVRVVEVLARLAFEPAKVVSWAEHHDDHEYALGDTVAPLKALMGDTALRVIETAWDVAIAEALGLGFVPDEALRSAVKPYDLAALDLEWCWCLGCPAEQLAVSGAFEGNERDAFEVLACALGPDMAQWIFSRRRRGFASALEGIEA